MSTQDDDAPDRTLEFDEFEDGDLFLPDIAPEEADKLMENIYQLETDLDSEKEERREERFTWILVIAIMFDVIALQAIDGFFSFVLVFLLQLTALLGIAQKLGVDWAVKLLGWLLHYVSEKFNSDREP